MTTGIVGTDTIAVTTNLTSWMMSGVTCSVIWPVILILKSLFAPMPRAGVVAEAEAVAVVIITGVATTAIMVIIATMVATAIMVGVMDRIALIMAHTGSLAFMAHRQPLHPTHTALQPGNGHRQRHPLRQWLTDRRLTGQRRPGPRSPGIHVPGHPQLPVFPHRSHPRQQSKLCNSHPGRLKHLHKRDLKTLIINCLQEMVDNCRLYSPSEFAIFKPCRKY